MASEAKQYIDARRRYRGGESSIDYMLAMTGIGSESRLRGISVNTCLSGPSLRRCREGSSRRGFGRWCRLAFRMRFKVKLGWHAEESQWPGLGGDEKVKLLGCLIDAGGVS